MFSSFEIVLLIVMSIAVGAGIVYCFKKHMTRTGDSLKGTLIWLWHSFCQETGAADGKAFRKKVLSFTKKVCATLWTGACWVVAWLIPPPQKHIFGEDLDVALRAVVAEYVYAPFLPEVLYRYDLTSCITISVYTQHLATPDIVQELVWHTQAVFQRYLTAHNLCFEYTVVPYSVDNKISICIYYCEYATEYVQYRNTCREATYLSIEQTCPPLPEQLSTKGNGIVLGYSFSKWQKSEQVAPILWDLQKAPHAIVGGPSGSGKSVYTLWLAEQMLSQGFDVCICDYKGFGDYRSFRGSYATGADCDELLRRFCGRFDSARKTGTTDGKPVAMIFDEFTAFAMSKSKREHEELMQLLSGVFLMGRSYNFHLILVSQRFDADALKTAYREQCGVKVHMGASISQQSATMLFPNSEIDKSARLEEFCGYLSTPQQDLEIIITPKFDLTALHKRVSRLSRGLR